MERIFIEDFGEKYPKGTVRDYPSRTWNDFFPGFMKFTRPVEEVAVEAVTAPPKKGRKQAHG